MSDPYVYECWVAVEGNREFRLKHGHFTKVATTEAVCEWAADQLQNGLPLHGRIMIVKHHKEEYGSEFAPSEKVPD
jgi:hypothetical protein